MECEACKKWRRVDEAVIAASSFPVSFQCSDNTWSTEYASCNVPQEAMHSDEYVDTSSSTNSAAATSSSAEASVSSSNELTEYTANPSDMTWFKLWNWIREAPTVPEVQRRLEKVEECYPGSKTYVAFLRRTMSTWAICISAWILTFDFKASSMQEQIFSSLKVVLGHGRHPLHEFLKFLRAQLAGRQINIAVKQSKQRTTELRDNANVAGFTNLFGVASAALTKEGELLLLEETINSTAYEVNELVKDEDINAALEEAAFRRSSYARFKCLTEEVLQQPCEQRGRFFRLKSVSQELGADLVYVARCGSFASTSPYYARMGIPGKHILALFRLGYVRINLVKHCLPVYLRSPELLLATSCSMFTASALVLKVQDRVIDATHASWNWAVNFTSRRWAEIGLGGESFEYLVYPTPAALRAGPESRLEQAKKIFHQMLPCVCGNDANWEKYLVYFENWKKDQADHAVILYKARVQMSSRATQGLSVSGEKRGMTNGGAVAVGAKETSKKRKTIPTKK